MLDHGTAVSVWTREESLMYISTLGWGFAILFMLLLWISLEMMDHAYRKKDGLATGAASRERLFGHQVLPSEEAEALASEAEPSGGEQRDEGPPDGPG